MAYSYSGWANEFASVEEKKEKPGLGERSPYDQPAKSNSPTFTQTVVQNYNDTRQDDTPLESNSIVTVPVKPSTITDNSRENKYVEEQRYSQKLKNKLLDTLIETNTTPHTPVELLGLSAAKSSSNNVLQTNGGTITAQLDSSATFQSWLDGKGNAWDIISLDQTSKRNEADLFNKYDVLHKAINGTWDDFKGAGSLSQSELQDLYNLYDGGVFDEETGALITAASGTNETDYQRLQRIDLRLKADNIKVSELIQEVVNQYEEGQEAGYKVGDLITPGSATEKALKGVSVLYDPVASFNKFLKKITEVVPELSFTAGTKETTNNILNRMGRDNILDIGSTTATYQTDNFSFSSLITGLLKPQDITYEFYSPNVTVTKDSSGLGYSASKNLVSARGPFPIRSDFETDKAYNEAVSDRYKFSVDGSFDSDAGAEFNLTFNQGNLLGTGVGFKGESTLGPYGKTWSGKLDAEYELFSKTKNAPFFTNPKENLSSLDKNYKREKGPETGSLTSNIGFNADLAKQKLSGYAGVNWYDEALNAKANVKVTLNEGGQTSLNASLIKELTGGNPLMWFRK
tara:strand:- start:123 stop:1838 length:1716 start_codon:yes stop_codon:yes gene_type:complete